MRERQGEGGFILPMAIILTVVLAISGASFMQLDFLEQRLVSNEVVNERSFYLASAGLERARAAFKIPEDLSWTYVLDGTYDLDGDDEPDTPVDDAPACLDTAPTLCLCPPDLASGCVMPPFQTVARNPRAISNDGEPVRFPDPPFDDTAREGRYTVRAFNDEPGLLDTNQTLTLRALGIVRGQETLLEATVQATSGLGLINCEGDDPAAPCPARADDESEYDHLDSREPRTLTELPSLDAQYYQTSRNFPWVQGSYLLSENSKLDLEDDTFYLVDGDVFVNGQRATGVVIVSTGTVHVVGSTDLSDAIVVGLADVQLQGTYHQPILLSAPVTSPPYPAVISGGSVRADAHVDVNGTVYAAGPIHWRAPTLRGLLIGADVLLHSERPTLVTDDGEQRLYELMPGFVYPAQLRSTVVLKGTWRELR